MFVINAYAEQAGISRKTGGFTNTNAGYTQKAIQQGVLNGASPRVSRATTVANAAAGPTRRVRRGRYLNSVIGRGR